MNAGGFRGDVRVLLNGGGRGVIGGLRGQQVEAMTRRGEWHTASVVECGRKLVHRITVERAGVQREIFAAADQQWWVLTSKKSKVVRRTDNLARKAAIASASGVGKLWRVLDVDEAKESEPVFTVNVPHKVGFAIEGGILCCGPQG